MAITRTPIIDDDGTGTTGTVIDNAWKTELYNQIDGGIGTTWLTVPFNAANFSALAPMVWTVGPAAIARNKYTLSGRILFWSFYVSWFSGSNVLSGSPSPTISMTLPAGLVAIAAQKGLVNYCIVPGVPVAAGLLVEFPGGSRVDITKAAGGNFALSDTPGMITTLTLEVG